MWIIYTYKWCQWHLDNIISNEFGATSSSVYVYSNKCLECRSVSTVMNCLLTHSSSAVMCTWRYWYTLLTGIILELYPSWKVLIELIKLSMILLKFLLSAFCQNTFGRFWCRNFSSLKVLPHFLKTICVLEMLSHLFLLYDSNVQLRQSLLQKFAYLFAL